MTVSRRRVVATIEVRMTSTRLPGKIMKPLMGEPLLSRLVERVRRARSLDEVVVATTVNPQDDRVEEWARRSGVAFYRGSEEDVLLRVLLAQQEFRSDVIVELTGDCPFLDPEIIDETVGFYLTHDFDYVSNSNERTYPLGLDVKVFSRKALEEVNRLTLDPADREHVSLYLYEHPERYSVRTLLAPAGLFAPDLRICVDTAEDFAVVEAVFKALHPMNPAFGARDIVRFLRDHPEIAALNSSVKQRPARAASEEKA